MNARTIEADAAWGEGAVDLAACRAAVRGRPRLAYERIEPTPEFGRIREEVDRIAAGGAWALAGNRLDSLRPPIAWTHPNRSFEFNLHSWRPLNLLLAADDATGDARYVSAATDVALDWLTTYQLELLDLRPHEALRAAAAHRATMAWNDMATGLRAYRLAYIAEAALDAGRDEAIVQVLVRSLLFHQALLAQKSFFSQRHNHGVYQALGQLAAARRLPFLPAMAEMFELARARTARMVERSFFPSGAHRENSAGYQHVIVGSFVGARDSGLLEPEASAVIAAAEDVLGWMVMTNGSLATFGDTDPTTPSPSSGRTTASNALLRHLLSGENDGGEEVPQGLKVIPDAGYVFFRSGGTYLAQTTGFHSGVHKHADHFSFIWCETRRELLIDPGKFGYLGKMEPGSGTKKAGGNYSDPRRLYIETTRAHNCVEIDGRDYQLGGDLAHPYFSGLRQAAVTGDGLLVTRAQGLHFGVEHWRTLILLPDRFLLVLDWLDDASGAAHDFRQWFQIAQDRSVERCGGGFAARLHGRRTLRLASLLPGPAPGTLARGQTDPDLLGWRSERAHSLVPSPTVSFDAQGRSAATFATLLCLSEDLTPDPRNRIDLDLSGGRLGWRDDVGDNVVEFVRDAGSFDVRFRCDPRRPRYLRSRIG